ncbi:DUF320-domain-containing protein [Conidiobolus coronatus NRRL 28638]|uniref:DUF320-domain-containing protein n=1 Tax=Conidiobolus coronatus (strain ATCC 28846 / CBS 209.66 / NRRL 28638) TaxID=796925 RepID=A0A137NWR1_CONC2|nr:DUF320-domain-containing protein [Conidiobolus coronatus NRRL 28638]|eukprot:KXN67275.1 DUF320-domain-containing protein [Conidiobolus coronatus NRRL 28638]
MKFLIVLSALAQLAYSNPIDATGASESPGTLSGNVVQLPLDIPVNAVGNTINVIGAGNPTFGNSGATASPGLLSGNFAQVPAQVPVNVSGNSVDVIGVLNPAFGNTSTNDSKNL